MAVSELIYFATAVSTFPIFDIYLWVAESRGHVVNFLVGIKFFAKLGGSDT